MSNFDLLSFDIELVFYIGTFNKIKSYISIDRQEVNKKKGYNIFLFTTRSENKKVNKIKKYSMNNVHTIV